MISKLIVWGDTRERTIDRLTRALDEYRVVGVKTTLPFFRWLVRQPEFLAAEFDTTYLDRVLASRNGEPFVAAARTRRARRGGRRRPRRVGEVAARHGGRRAGRRPVAARGPARAAADGSRTGARMTFEIEINGRTRRVTLEPERGSAATRRSVHASASTTRPCRSTCVPPTSAGRFCISTAGGASTWR